MQYEIFAIVEVLMTAGLIMTFTSQLWICCKKKDEAKNTTANITTDGLSHGTTKAGKTKTNTGRNLMHEKKEQDTEKKEEAEEGDTNTDEPKVPGLAKDMDEKGKRDAQRSTCPLDVMKAKPELAIAQADKIRVVEEVESTASEFEDFVKKNGNAAVKKKDEKPTPGYDNLDEGKCDSDLESSAPANVDSRRKSAIKIAEAKKVLNLQPKTFAKGAKEEAIAKGVHKKRQDYKTMDDVDSDWGSQKEGPEDSNYKKEKKEPESKNEEKESEAAGSCAQRGGKKADESESPAAPGSQHS